MFPQAYFSWLGMEKLNVTQQSTHSPIKRNVLQHEKNTKKLKPGLVTFYDIWVFSQRKMRYYYYYHLTASFPGQPG